MDKAEKEIASPIPEARHTQSLRRGQLELPPQGVTGIRIQPTLA